MSEQLQALLAGFDPHLPLDRARTIPASWYADSHMFDAERRTIFGQNWIVVGRTDQVAKSGHYLTLNVAGEPILVIRGDDGVLRAFINVCRHRAAPLLSEPCGHAAKLRCRYHGWTYDLAGQLRGTPDFDGVQDFCREDNGLVELAVATWGPLVAVCLEPPTGTFLQHLSPLPARTTEAGIEALKFAARREYDLNCNWKVFVDNYLDGGYHINTVHPGLAGMIDYSQYRTDVFDTTSVQSSPLTSPDGSVRPGTTAQYWYVYPNLMLNIYGGLMDTNLVLPLSPTRCRVVFDFYFAETGPASDYQFQLNSMAMAHQVQLEDIGICEDVQRGLGSWSFQTGRFSVKRENAGYHFHQLLARSLRG
jgi:choline monooxygenase